VALQVVSMEQLRMEVVLEPERTGDSVAEVCRRRGISRKTFYGYRRRYLSEGSIAWWREPDPGWSSDEGTIEARADSSALPAGLGEV
jgi:transposase-like protein